MLTIKCRFIVTEDYRCVIEDHDFNRNCENFSFEGEHQSKKCNEDVKLLQIKDCKMPLLPQNIGDTFKNIEKLHILNSRLKSLTKFGLKQFENLKEFYVIGNAIEFLPGDLFELTKNIEIIDLSSNKIKFIGPRILDDVRKLKIANFLNNASINCLYHHAPHSKYTLEQLKEKIRADCKPPMDERKMLMKYGRVEGVNLKINKSYKSSFLQDLEQFLAVDDFKDFTIKVADKEFKVHKFVFAARSQTFAELIKNNPEAEDLVLQDISVEVFECILGFIYTDELPETENALEVFTAAEKLKIRGLIKTSAKLLKTSIKYEKNLEVLYKIFKLGLKFDHKELKLKAFKMIKKQFPDKELKWDLVDQPELLKARIDAKLFFDGKQKI